MISLVAFSLLAMLQVGDTVRMFPVVEGRNLEGQTLVMPRDFAGDVNVVFVAFKRDNRLMWTPGLQRSTRFERGVPAFASTSCQRSRESIA
jgi:hypothetical protein